MKIQITISGPVGSGKGRILAKLKRVLESEDWTTAATIEERVYGSPTYSFTAVKDDDAH